MTRGPVPAETAAELKERIEAERGGEPFVVYRDGENVQVIHVPHEAASRIIGRGPAVDLDLGFDPQVSRAHAELEPVGAAWALVDDGLSRNGSFVNGDRVVGRRRLRDGDVARIGDTQLLYRDPRAGTIDETAAATGKHGRPNVTEQQRRVLVGLCRPFREGSEFATPATNRQIATEVFLSVDTVKTHLRVLFDRFGLGDLPQNEKRTRLAELALRTGVVTPRDLV